MPGSTMHLIIFNCNGIMSPFHLLSSLRIDSGNFLYSITKKKHKNSLQVSRSPAHLPMYCKITFENIWLGARISIHFILKTKQRENVNKYACRLLSDSKPLGNNGDQL